MNINNENSRCKWTGKKKMSEPINPKVEIIVTDNWLLHLKTNKRQVEKAQINQRENENREVTTDKRNFKTLKKFF